MQRARPSFPPRPARVAAFAAAVVAFSLFHPHPESRAAEAQPAHAKLPEGGVSLLPDDLRAAGVVSSKTRDAGSAEWTTVEGPGFDQALRFTLDRLPDKPWDTQVKWVVSDAIAPQDVLLAGIWARVIEGENETQEGKFRIAMQQSHHPFTPLMKADFTVGKEWTFCPLPARVGPKPRHAYAEGELQVSFNVGMRQQTIELAAPVLLNYRNTLDLADMPQPVITYAGSEPDAPWRAEAAARIERHRKGDLAVVVRGPDGQPVQGATVGLDMTRHAFGFGTCLRPQEILDEGADEEQFRHHLLANFNKAVYEGEMKWVRMDRGSDEDKRRLHERVSDSLDWLQGHGFEVRGHTMVWPGWGSGRWYYSPPRLKPIADAGDAETLAREVEQRIRHVGALYAGRVTEWDVINEAVRNHQIIDVVGRDAMIDWFKWAREADPYAELYYNENVILSGGAVDTKARQQAMDNVRFLIDGGAPIDGIGMQCHFGSTLVGMEKMKQILDEFAATGLRLQVTEFDVAIPDETVQAAFLRDFYTMAFSHPAVDAILMWGFWEKKHWKPEAAMFRADWSPKPMVEAYRDLLFNQWWTRDSAQTDANGQAAFRGFHGDYTLTVSHGDLQTTLETRIEPGKETKQVTVTLNE